MTLRTAPPAVGARRSSARRLLAVAALLGGVAWALPDLTEFDPPLGIYHYTIAWQGARVATADVSVRREDPYYHVEVHAKTGSTLDLVYKLRYRGEGKIDAQDLSAVEAFMQTPGGSTSRIPNPLLPRWSSTSRRMPQARS